MQSEQMSALREGALASAGLLVGIVPWGIVAGVAMVSAGLTQSQAVAMSAIPAISTQTSQDSAATLNLSLSVARADPRNREAYRYSDRNGCEQTQIKG